jgi:hypothetical protein
MVVMLVNVCELAGGREVLAGRALGRKALAKLIAGIENPSAPDICFLDFGSSALVTGSFLAEFVIGLSRHARAVAPNIYPVCIIVDEISFQELELLASSSGQVIPVCSGLKRGHPKELRFVGSLDVAHLEALKRVEHLGCASAKALAEGTATRGDKIGITAWHNRLAALSRRGLIIEENDGRQKLYRALNQGA